MGISFRLHVGNYAELVAPSVEAHNLLSENQRLVNRFFYDPDVNEYLYVAKVEYNSDQFRYSDMNNYPIIY